MHAAAAGAPKQSCSAALPPCAAGAGGDGGECRGGDAPPLADVGESAVGAGVGEGGELAGRDHSTRAVRGPGDKAGPEALAERGAERGAGGGAGRMRLSSSASRARSSAKLALPAATRPARLNYTGPAKLHRRG